MTVNRVVRLVAGAFILLSVLMFNANTPQIDIFAEVNWMWFTLFVGANLFQSGITNWCFMSQMLEKFGVRVDGDSCSV